MTRTGAELDGVGMSENTQDTTIYEVPADTATPPPTARPWPALWALVLGFFMILVDSTIVSVATPTIMEKLGAGVSEVIWVSSAYLLAYVVPLLIMGRLGDRLGPKRVYLAGLVVFTLSSLACGFTDSVTGLVIARIVQGFGASMMTPQTMAVITRLFPANERGKAMAIWGATAGIATLIGPLLGGLLIDAWGWEWIFFVNVPVGILGFILVLRLVPRLPVHEHRFDLIGVALNGLGLFCIVFGLQEAQTYEWGHIWGPFSVWGLIITGVVILGLFVAWQAVNRGEPLLPLGLFSDRNFSVSNAAIVLVGFAVTAMPFPLMIWAQAARGLTPTQAALLSAPMALLTLAISPWVGGLVDRMHPRILASFGAIVWGIALFWLSRAMDTTSPVWLIGFPMALLGLGSSFVWGPLATAATANLPPMRAGAGSGVYNTTRQVGAVIGSAVVATVMSARIAAHLGGGDFNPGAAVGHELPPMVKEGISQSMAETILVSAVAIVLAGLVALAFERPRHQRGDGATEGQAAAPVDLGH